MSVYTKFGLIWIKLVSTSFTNVQLDLNCKVDSSLTSGGWNWLKFCVAWLFCMVHMCIKFDSHWTHIASTCFTMWPTDHKLKLDNTLTWVMGFWLQFGLVELSGSRIMLKKVQGKWDPLSCT